MIRQENKTSCNWLYDYIINITSLQEETKLRSEDYCFQVWGYYKNPIVPNLLVYFFIFNLDEFNIIKELMESLTGLEIIDKII